MHSFIRRPSEPEQRYRMRYRSNPTKLHARLRDIQVMSPLRLALIIPLLPKICERPKTNTGHDA